MPITISIVFVIFSVISDRMELYAKLPDDMSFVKVDINKVCSKSWAKPTATAMNVTASICNRMGTFIPDVALVGSILRMGASFLNPTPSLADLKRSRQEIVACLYGEMGIIENILTVNLKWSEKWLQEEHVNIDGNKTWRFRNGTYRRLEESKNETSNELYSTMERKEYHNGIGDNQIIQKQVCDVWRELDLDVLKFVMRNAKCNESDAKVPNI